MPRAEKDYNFIEKLFLDETNFSENVFFLQNSIMGDLGFLHFQPWSNDTGTLCCLVFWARKIGTHPRLNNQAQLEVISN